ncbi:MAG TPA: hypothetical protein VH063_20015 [Gaiellaceae bacterium]|nr:hypothetical protein [Gaiellaceae bacterium]
MVRCRLLGHHYRFDVEDRTMEWGCARCGAPGGQKAYASADEAARFAEAFNQEDSAGLGRRAPLIGLFPLRLWRAWRDHGG